MEPVKSRETFASILGDMKEKVDNLLAAQATILRLLGGESCLQDKCEADAPIDCMLADMQNLKVNITRALRQVNDIANLIS